MKPDWKDAPEWAAWVAMDEDGDWYWYEFQPSRGIYTFLNKNRGRSDLATEACDGWAESLEPRP